MTMRNMLVVFLQVALAIVAICCGLAILFLTKNQVYFAIGALCALSSAQLIGALATITATRRLEDQLDEFDDTLGELRQRSETSERALDQAQGKWHQVTQRGQAQEQTFASGLSELRQSYSDLAEHLANSLSNDRIEPVFPPAQFSEPLLHAATAPAAPETLPDVFLTSLEPIIDVNSGATAHYRLRTTLAGVGDQDVPYQVVMSNADEAGMRPSLDAYVVYEALSLIDRLRQRNPSLKVFVSLGVPTLLDQTAMRDIIRVLNENISLASGLVVEIPQSALVSLSDHGIAGLALLARNGVAMALSDVAIAGLDLASLRQLGVKFFSLQANTLFSQYGLSPAIVGFTQSARAMQFQIIVTDVATPAAATAIPQVARFASGPLLAEARRVKSSAERELEVQHRVAA